MVGEAGGYPGRLQDVSAMIRFGQKKHGRFGQKRWTFRPKNMDVSAKKIDVSAKYIYFYNNNNNNTSNFSNIAFIQ